MDYQTGMTQAFIYRSLIVLIALVGWILGYRLLSGGLTLREGEVRFKIFGQIEAKTAQHPSTMPGGIGHRYSSVTGNTIQRRQDTCHAGMFNRMGA